MTEPWVSPSYCSACHANHRGGSRNCGCSCHLRAARRPVRARAVLAAAVLALGLLPALAACRQAAPSETGCPAGQWLVKKPGAGWECTAPPGGVPVPVPASFSPAPPPCPAVTLSPAPLRGKPDCKDGAP